MAAGPVDPADWVPASGGDGRGLAPPAAVHLQRAALVGRMMPDCLWFGSGPYVLDRFLRGGS